MRMRAFHQSSILVVVILILGTLTLTFGEGVRKRIRFAKGRNSTVINNAVLREDVDQYIVGAKAGQKMKVQITSVESNASFEISKPRQGGFLPGAGFEDDARTWSGELPETGDYTIEVAPTRGNATYRLTVEIR
jgi:type II secretory pathway pseudopilin PulG